MNLLNTVSLLITNSLNKQTKWTLTDNGKWQTKIAEGFTYTKSDPLENLDTSVKLNRR